MLGLLPASAPVVTGYGVGGGVAAVCAAWAALKFPQAQVTLVNAGSPQPVGNADFDKVRRATAL